MQTPASLCRGLSRGGCGDTSLLGARDRRACAWEESSTLSPFFFHVMKESSLRATLLLDVHMQTERQRVGVQPPEGVAAFVRIVSDARVIV